MRDTHFLKSLIFSDFWFVCFQKSVKTPPDSKIEILKNWERAGVAQDKYIRRTGLFFEKNHSCVPGVHIFSLVKKKCDTDLDKMFFFFFWKFPQYLYSHFPKKKKKFCLYMSHTFSFFLLFLGNISRVVISKKKEHLIHIRIPLFLSNEKMFTPLNSKIFWRFAQDRMGINLTISPDICMTFFY